jgi:hypothetical protein
MDGTGEKTPVHIDMHNEEWNLPRRITDHCNLKQQGQIKLHLLHYGLQQHLTSLLC